MPRLFQAARTLLAILVLCAGVGRALATGGPDLHVLISAVPRFPKLGSAMLLSPLVTNTGAAASSVVLTATVAGPFLFQSAGGPGWVCLGPALGAASPSVQCSTPALGPASSSGVTVTLTTPLSPATAAYTVTVSSDAADQNPANNFANGLLATFAHSANGNPWDVADAATAAYSAAHTTVPDSGAVTDGGQDAFDGFGQLRVRVLAAPNPVETTIGGLGLTYAAGGHWDTTHPQMVDVVRVSRRLDAPPGVNWIRYVDTFENTDGANAISLLAMWGGDLGSDFGTAVRNSSTGDLFLTSADNWAVTVQQAAPFDPAIDAPLGYAIRSLSGSAYLGPYISNQSPITSTVWPSSGNDKLGHVFQFSIAAGASARLAYFVYRGKSETALGPQDCDYYGGCSFPAANAQVAETQLNTIRLTLNPPLCDLRADELAQIVNWSGIVESCLYLPLAVK